MIPAAAAAAGDVTQLLQDWQAGNPDAFDQALELVYHEMHRAAQSYVRRGNQGQTLQPTALIHEVYLRLAAGKTPPQIRDRRHFLALAAKVMRRILVDRARERCAAKRGGGGHRMALDDHLESAYHDLDQFLLVDSALNDLFAEHADLARVIELRYYAGFEIQETAEILGISTATVGRRQRAAEAWLARSIATRTRD
jgi:RNA polymerase sigma factor (TIGR02999 family)